MSETEFPKKYCPKCKLEKIKYIYFSPKGNYCSDCNKLIYRKRSKHVTVKRKRAWEAFSLLQKRPFEWESI